MKRIAAVLALAALAAAAPAHARPVVVPALVWGEARALEGGSARAWVALDVDGSTHSMGVAIEETPWVGATPGPAELLLPLPASALAGIAAGQPLAFRVRREPTTGQVLVMLEGLGGAPAAPIAQRVAK